MSMSKYTLAKYKETFVPYFCFTVLLMVLLFVVSTCAIETKKQLQALENTPGPTSLVCIEVINNREIDFSGFSSIESQPDNGTVIWTMRSNKGSMRYIQWPGEVCSTDRNILATWNLEGS